jgi:hypothetical protein
MHRHACDHGHYWDCEGTAVRFSETEPSVCMCLDHGVPMEDGDHSNCTIELLKCPLHRPGHLHSADSELLVEDQVEPGWEPIQIPDDLEQMLQNWNDDPEPKIGWCLLCDSAIRTEDDLIPATNTHKCAPGRSFEAKFHDGQPGRS